MVDEQTTVSGGHGFVFADAHELYQVDGDLEPIAEISGSNRGPEEALIDGAVGRGEQEARLVKARSLGAREPERARPGRGSDQLERQTQRLAGRSGSRG